MGIGGFGFVGILVELWGLWVEVGIEALGRRRGWAWMMLNKPIILPTHELFTRLCCFEVWWSDC